MSQGTVHQLIIIHRMANREAKKFGRESVRNGSKNSVAMVLAQEIEVLRVVVKR